MSSAILKLFAEAHGRHESRLLYEHEANGRIVEVRRVHGPGDPSELTAFYPPSVKSNRYYLLREFEIRETRRAERAEARARRRQEARLARLKDPESGPDQAA
jgi:hypothetical protein